jgi:hypothetical protein
MTYKRPIGVVVHACDPSTKEAEAGGLNIHFQDGLTLTTSWCVYFGTPRWSTNIEVSVQE